MQAVNAVTQYLLGKMKSVETENKKVMLVDIYDSTKKSAEENGMSAEDVEKAAMTSCKMAVAMNAALNFRELVTVVAKAGRVVCEVADPDMVREAGAEIHTPEQLQEMAQEAGRGLAMLMEVLNELLPAVQMDIDDEHIAEHLIADGRKVRDEEKAADSAQSVKAKPVAGWAVPFGKRIEPSQN